MTLMTLPKASTVGGNTSFLEAATRIGQQLCRDAIWHEDRCTWMGWAMTLADGNAIPAYRTASVSLYDGVAGIALFLGKLAALAPSRRLEATVNGAVQQVLARLPDLDTPPQRGLYTGTLGAAHMLCEVGSALDRLDWVEKGLALATEHAPHPYADDALDIIAGCASAVPALIHLGKRYDRPDLVQSAIGHAERLMAAGVTDTSGLSWPSIMPKHRNLLGYAHGTSGMGMALLEAHAISGNEALLHGAKEAFRYERSWFDAQQQGWPDFRIDHITPGAAALPPSCNCSWCAGSSGIGLTRLRMMELMPTDEMAAVEVNTALQDASRLLTTPVVPQDLCLCHGLAGIADFVLSAGIQLKQDAISAHAEQVGRFIIDQYLDAEIPLPCGVQQRGEAPGLMLGIAGIGYFLLRLAEREKLPSVLLLRP